MAAAGCRLRTALSAASGGKRFVARPAAGVWLTPVGPPLGGIYWLTFVIPAVVLLLLLLALSTPSKPPKTKDSAIPENAEGQAMSGTVVAFSVFFWILVTIALIAVLTKYF